MNIVVSSKVWRPLPMHITRLSIFGYDLHLDQCSCGALDALKGMMKVFDLCLIDQELLKQEWRKSIT